MTVYKEEKLYSIYGSETQQHSQLFETPYFVVTLAAISTHTDLTPSFN